MQKDPVGGLIAFAKKQKSSQNEIAKRLLKVLIKWKDRPERLVKVFNSLLSTFDKRKLSIKAIVKHGKGNLLIF